MATEETKHNGVTEGISATGQDVTFATREIATNRNTRKIIEMETTWAETKRNVIVYKIFGEACGVVIVDIDTTTEANAAYIYNLCVSKSDRYDKDKDVGKTGFNERVGTILRRRAEAWARKQGSKYVALEWARRDSPQWVLEWYMRHGYKPMYISYSGTQVYDVVFDKPDTEIDIDAAQIVRLRKQLR